MAKDVGTIPEVQKSFYRLMEAIELYDAGRVSVTTLRDNVRLHIQEVNKARGDPLDGTLAG